VNFALRAPSLRNPRRKAIDFTNVLLNLPQVARLIKHLMRQVLSIVMTCAIDCACQLRPIVSQVASCLKVDDTHKLLIKFTSTVMQTIKGTHISLINLMMLYSLRVTHVGPVITPDGPFVGSPPCEAVN
jgi:hypothetical protein